MPDIFIKPDQGLFALVLHLHWSGRGKRQVDKTGIDPDRRSL